MKKNYLFLGLFLIFLSSVTTAQTTLYASDSPQIGDEFINANDTTNIDTILPISTGASQTWDFSWIRNDSQDTTNYVDPATTPNASTFPTANLAQPSQQGYTYFLSDQNHLEVIGGQMDTIAVLYEDPLTYFIFPMSFDSVFADNGVMNVTIAYDTTVDIGGQTVTIDSVRIKRTMILADTVSGWGSIITPVATYDNVLQLKSNEVDTNSISVHTTGMFSTWIPIPNTTTTTTIDKWEWFTKYKKTALVSLEVSADTIKKISYFLDPSANIETENIGKTTISIFPNPASSQINFSSETPVLYVEIFDMKGNFIQTVSIKNQSMSVANLSSGNYLIKSFDRDYKLTGINKLTILR